MKIFENLSSNENLKSNFLGCLFNMKRFLINLSKMMDRMKIMILFSLLEPQTKLK